MPLDGPTGHDEVARRLVSLVDRYASEESFSGAVLVTRGEEELLLAARGLAHRGFGIPNVPETRFDTASLGKLFTAVAVFRLAARGVLGLEERITEIVDLSGTRIPPAVTVAHCLTHTSGIADDADEEAGEAYEEIWKSRPCYAVRETADFVPQFAHKEPMFEPGTRSRYNNCAFVLVGLALEARTGLAFHEVIRQEVIVPAGLERTGYVAKDDIEPGIAEGYATVKGPDGAAAGVRKNIYSFPPIGSPDAGVLTTVRDLRCLFAAIEGGALLPPAWRDRFLSPQVDAFPLKDGGLRRYGYCLEHDFDPDGRRIRFGKDGQNPGVAAIAMRYPDTDGFVAILANQDANVWSLCRELAREAEFVGEATQS